MAKWTRAWTVVSLWLACWLPVPALAASPQPVRAVDDRGAEIVLPAAPQRIVSLLPSLTESVCLLDACGRLVGVDRWSNWPASVQQLPRLGGLDDPQIEALLALRPDLVLIVPSPRLAARLRALGLTVAEFDASDAQGVTRVLSRLAMLLGDGAAGPRLVQSIEQTIAQAAASVAPARRGQRVYLELSATPYAAGDASYLGYLLRRLGGLNIVPARMGPFPQLSPEFVLRAQPDLIILPAAEAARLPRRAGWPQLRALTQGHVCAVPPAQWDLLSRPGPRLGQAAQVLAACLRGEQP